MANAIVWFKNIIRLQDNIVLQEAINDGNTILPLYIFDKNLYAPTKYGFTKTGSRRAQFEIESVQALQTALQQINSNLLIAHGNVVATFEEICTANNIATVYLQEEWAIEELELLEALEAALPTVKFVPIDSNTMTPLENLPKTVQQLPKIFTAFRNLVEKYTTIPEPVAAPKSINTLTVNNWGALPTIQQLGLLPMPQHKNKAIAAIGGEQAALQHLQQYVWTKKLPATYFETRNGLIGQDYSTKFSIWLANGCISARTIWAAVQEFELKVIKNKSTYWIYFELLWRDFFRTQFMQDAQPFFVHQGSRADKVVSKTLNKVWCTNWQQGTTGKDFVDANMKELLHTGFMSNRGRQNVASNLVHDLKLSWLYGAAWFEHALIDYDVYSNYGNWAYVAGVGNDPRQDRYFNIEKQAGMYDGDGAYRKLWAEVV